MLSCDMSGCSCEYIHLPFPYIYEDLASPFQSVRSCLNRPAKRFRRSLSLSDIPFPCNNELDRKCVAFHLWNRHVFGSRLLCFLVTRQLHHEEYTQHIERDEPDSPAEPDRNGWKGYRCNRDVRNALSRSTIHRDL